MPTRPDSTSLLPFSSAPRPTVALVSADADLAASLRQLLAAYDVEVHWSRDGESALDRAASGLPLDLVVVEAGDVQRGICRFLVELRRARAAAVPAVLVGDDVPSVLESLSSVRAVLVPPFREAALLRAIRETLRVPMMRAG